MDNNTVDIKNILVNQHFPKEERMHEFLKEIGNPYQFKCGGITINTRFNESRNSATLLECMKNLIV